MPSKLELWARAFRKAAKADRYQAITAWLEEQSWPADDDLARKAVEDTVHLMELVIRPGDPVGLLPLQVYDPDDARARYLLTFQGGKHEYVRLYCDDLARLDLAELYDNGVGFSMLTVERPAPGNLDPVESEQIEEAIRRDFAYDYGEDDIELVFTKGQCVCVEISSS